jgi:hypothetical protein
VGRFNLLPQTNTPALFQNLIFGGNLARPLRLPAENIVKPDTLSGASPAGFESFDIDEREDNPDTVAVFLDNPNIFEEHSNFLGIGSKRKAKKRLARFERKEKRKDNRLNRKVTLMQAKGEQRANPAAPAVSAWAQPNEVSGQFNPAVSQEQAPAGFQQFDTSFNLGNYQPAAGFDNYDENNDSFTYQGDGYEEFLGMGKGAKERRTARRQENQAAKKYKYETDRIRAKQGMPKDSVGGTIGKVAGSIAGIIAGKKPSDESGEFSRDTGAVDYGQRPPEQGKKTNTVLYVGIAVAVIGLIIYLKSKK